MAWLMAGEERPDCLADKAVSSLRNKRDELRLVLRGEVTEHHRYLLRELMGDLERIESKLLLIEVEIVRRTEPYRKQLERLDTISGVDCITAWTILAELGADMSAFPDAHHAASWAGLAPGSFESAGKRKSSWTRHGNRWLRRALCQSAGAITHMKDCCLVAHFYRCASKRGKNKAIRATAPQVLIIVFHILRHKTSYQERGGDYFDELNPERTREKLVRRLQRLGWDVVFKPPWRPAARALEPVLTRAGLTRRRGRPCKCAECGIECKYRRIESKVFER